MGRGRDAHPVADRHLAVVAAPRIAGICAEVAAHAAYFAQSAPNPWVLDFDPARGRVVDWHLSVVSADRSLADVVDRADAGAAAADVWRGHSREAESDRGRSAAPRAGGRAGAAAGFVVPADRTGASE